jgi:hypothetical protein
MDPEGPVSSINFSTGDSDSELMPAVCGFLPESEQFACDVPLLSMDQTELTLNYDSFEYRIDGNWSFQWNPFQYLQGIKPVSKPYYPIKWIP